MGYDRNYETCHWCGETFPRNQAVRSAGIFGHWFCSRKCKKEWKENKK